MDDVASMTNRCLTPDEVQTQGTATPLIVGLRQDAVKFSGGSAQQQPSRKPI
jgi:hypothetical protein